MAGVRGRSGGKRRGAGRKPLSDDLHRLRGTWRQERHGLPTIGATAIAPVPLALWAGVTSNVFRRHRPYRSSPPFSRACTRLEFW